MPRSQSIVPAVAVGILGLVSAFVPVLQTLEEGLGLRGLFELRGPRDAPDEVVIVSISRDSAETLGLPSNLVQWPRRVHADAIEAIAEAGAAAIVMDIAFETKRDEADDTRLAAAIERAGRVVLLEHIRAGSRPIPGLELEARELRQVAAYEPFRSRAIGAGPFTLPTFPIRTSQFWAFGAGDADGPMLPALALQAYLLDSYPAFIDSLAGITDASRNLSLPPDATLPGRLQDVMRSIRRIYQRDPDLMRRVSAALDESPESPESPESAEQRAAVEALNALYGGSSSRYLNFFGPSGTIRTYPFHEVLGAEYASSMGRDLAGKVVFVGYADREQSEQQDEFISVYSEETGLSLGGVEIGATAFANLLHRNSVVPLSRGTQVALLLVWGIVAGLIVTALRLPFAIAAACVLAILYLASAVALFSSQALWLPLAIPLGLQLPLLVIADTLLRYRRIAAQRETLRAALGPYAAPVVVERLARDVRDRREGSNVVFGTCLVTDVTGYTSLAERMEPDELAELMRRYFEGIGGTVTAHGGSVGDVAGDSMVGVWVASRAAGETVRHATAAALDIERQVRAFNLQNADTPLDTAIGIEAGRIALSPDGARGYQRPVGDIVNTAARIQSLNRVLDTRILMSGSVREGDESDRSRYLGRYLLLGKSRVLDIWDLQPVDGSPVAPQAAFREGLALFEAGAFEKAHVHFRFLAAEFERDGPARFYQRRCQHIIETGSAGMRDGAIVISTK